MGSESRKSGEQRALEQDAVCQEVSEPEDPCKGIEEELQRALCLKKVLLDQSSTGIAIFDEHGQCVEVNDSICEFVGGTKEQLLAANYNSLESWKKAGVLEKARMALAGNSEEEIEFAVKSTFGKDVIAHCRLIPFCLDERTHLMLMATDISERKEMEGAMRTLAESAMGRSGQDWFDQVTSDLCRWFNLDVSIIGGMMENGDVQTISVVLDGARVPDFSYSLCGTPCENVTQQGACLYPERICALFPEDKLLVDMEMEGYVGSPLMNRQGVVVGVLCGLSRRPLQLPVGWKDIMTVLGHRVAGELERRQMEERLVLAKVEAEAASKTKSVFLANMSHEIRTPLNGVLGMLQLLEMTTLDELQKTYVEDAFTASQNLLVVINDILDISRIEAGKIEIVEEEFKLADLVSTVSQLFAGQAVQKNIALDCVVNSSCPPVLLGDTGRIRQVFFNLVGNSVKFTDRGEVRILVHHEPVDGDAERVKLVCSVSDTGIGISPENMPYIFEPFSQVDGSYSRRFQGVGLGLSIVKRILEVMGGEVAVESEPGKGTTIHFHIPLKVGHATDMEQSVQGECSMVAFTPLMVLLVEDNLMNCLTMRKLLEFMGHTVECATTGREALEALRAARFDCILMDIQLSGMDGVEAVRRIRGGEAGVNALDIPIIALTAFAMKGDREKFLEAGMDDYLSKPICLDELKQALGRITVG